MTPGPTEHPPSVVLKDTNVTPFGMREIRRTPSAGAGPVLVIAIAQRKLLVAATGLGPRTTDIARSAW